MVTADMLIARAMRRTMRLAAAAALLVLAGCGAHTPAPQSVEHKPMSPTSSPRPRIAAAAASPISFARIASFPPPGWHVPRHVRLSPDGALVTYLQSESQSDQMALFALEVATGKHRVLVRASDLIASDQPLSRQEELRRERQRKRIKGVTAYSWAEHANVMLLPLGGNVYLRAADGKITQLTATEAPEIDPKLCSDGSQVAFVRNGELFVVDTASGVEKQLSKPAAAGITHGLSDFNGQEEFDEPSGFWWSNQCDAIAYLEVDERHVDKVPVMGYRHGADLQYHRYPRSGRRNPIVKLGVVDVASGVTRFVDMPTAAGFDTGDQYLGRVHFSDDSKVLYVQRLSRDQRRLALLRVEVASGKGVHIIEESDPAWVEMSPMLPLADGTLLWTAWRHGHRHIERRAANGTLLNTLTAGNWDVFSLVGVDKQRARVLFIANRDGLLDRQLYAAPLNGGELSRLTAETGVHDIAGNNPQLGFVDIHSSNQRLPAAVVRGPLGKVRGSIAVPIDTDFDKLGIVAPKLVTIAASEGAPDLRGALLLPPDMDASKKYPAVLMVYGGPGVQTVLNSYNPRLLWQHMAQRGVVVLQVDNRGSKGRGHDFETPIARRLGEVELSDQLRAADYLGALPYVDAQRLGIYGHSYGGYMAAMAMLRAPGRFVVGVAGSPVTDWRYYDTGYTERYMGTPANNAAGYDRSALNGLASQLQGKLMVVHALMDENVHFEHTATLIDALVAADKDFDLLVFPGERHGYRSPQARRYAYRRVVDYFAQYL